MSRTRIVCTLGPATDSDETLRALIRSGMNVARLNFSHGTPEDHARRVEMVRRIAGQEQAVVALLGDLQGPKIRVGEIANGPRLLKTGETLVLTSGTPASADQVVVNFDLLAQVVKPQEHLLLDDGNIELVVEHAEGQTVTTRVVDGGPLSSHKGVNFPGIDLPIPSLTPKDLQDLEWAAQAGLDYIALSFVRRAEDVVDLRQRLTAHGADIPIIAKIEKREAVAAIDAILEVTDGVMVARGDLGVEMPAEQVPIYQKQIISKANALGKPVITATQMLESMIQNPRPTRAEASDVANAILDGSDAVMLSAETATGAYPVETVEVMSRIALRAESACTRFGPTERRGDPAQAVASAGYTLAREAGAKLIAVFTRTGSSAQIMSKERPSMPIVAFTPFQSVYRRLALWWGVTPRFSELKGSTEALVAFADADLQRNGMAKPGDEVVIIGGMPIAGRARTNFVRLHRIGDLE